MRTNPMRRPRTAALALAGAAAALLLPAGLSSTTAGAAPGPWAVASCPAAAAGTFTCQALVRTVNGADVTTATPSGYGPAQLRTAYALPTTASGHPLVAVVDAYGDSHAFSDLTAYRTNYGLPRMARCSGSLTGAVCFSQVTQTGATTGLPANNTGWDQEQSLDLDMVSAVCPQCSILLVDSNTSGDASMGTAVDEAVTLGAVVVSNSYSGPETTAPESFYSHPGVAIVASTGDAGHTAVAQAPATYPGVVAVGGTTLSSVSPRTETAWNGAGSSCSVNYAKPAWQVGVATACTTRAVADVSADANPATGVAVYDQGWMVFGGTSVSSPLISAVIAEAGNWAAFGTSGASYLYAHRAGLNDVTSGANGGCAGSLCHAGAGWDGPTGLGTPDGLSAF